MSYRLVVVTHGRSRARLDRTIESFAAMADEPPEERHVILDGPADLPPVEPLGVWECHAGPHEGFCSAMRRAWQIGQRDGPSHTFLLEHDFVFLRPFSIREMTVILTDAGIAQVQLMRQPVNDLEIARGSVLMPDEGVEYERDGRAWIEHTAYFTTNPSLMRSAFMRQNPWPTGGECEGRYGLQLEEEGYRFAVLGNGDPWVEHIGRRDGKGY